MAGIAILGAGIFATDGMRHYKIKAELCCFTNSKQNTSHQSSVPEQI
jgi:hypothetical protein